MTTSTDYTIKILPNDHAAPAGKLADAEVHFTAGVFAGLRLIGFAIWQRRNGAGYNVTFPARTYSVGGERRSFALLRPNYTQGTDDAQTRVSDLILQAYAAHLADLDAIVSATAGTVPTFDPKTAFSVTAPAAQTTPDTRQTAAPSTPTRTLDLF